MLYDIKCPNIRSDMRLASCAGVHLVHITREMERSSRGYVYQCWQMRIQTDRWTDRSSLTLFRRSQQDAVGVRPKSRIWPHNGRLPHATVVSQADKHIPNQEYLPSQVLLRGVRVCMIQVHMYIHTYIHTYMHTYIHTCMRALGSARATA